MKKTFTVSVLLILVVFAYAQSDFSVHFGQTYSKFKFVDSDGVSDETISSDINYSYGVNYTQDIEYGIFIRPEIGYKNWGAISKISNSQNLEWSLNYFDINFGGGYVYDVWKFKPYAGISPYISFLYKAEQIVGSSNYNMLEANSIKRFDFGLSEFIGVKYDFTYMAGIYFELNNSTGLMQLEKNLNDGESQKLFNRAVSIRFGLIFNLESNDKTPKL